jgi:hypothetical protein
MKRTAAIAVLLLFATLGLSAAVWDGSAIAGGSGDFPEDGLFGACNSFPHDTSVTITNLENGKTVAVTITRNVDNPGVFIALSPKAAAELGMHAGTATRIRAEALTASQAVASLPPARAGETADPDFNPKVYVERDKAALAAGAAAPATAPQTTAPQTTVPAAAPVAAAPVAVAAMPPSTQENEAASKPEAVPNASVPVASGESPARAPEVYGGSELSPSPVQASNVPIVDPNPEQSAPNPPEKAAAEPNPQIVPDVLPEAVLSRIVEPVTVTPTPFLAEAPAPASETETEFETIVLQRPSYSATVEAAALAEATPPSPVDTSSVEHPTKAAEENGSGELQSPVVPSPTEGIGTDKPAAAESGEKSIVLEPAEPRPPSAPAASAPAPTPAAAPMAVVSPATEATTQTPTPPETGKEPSSPKAAQVPPSVPLLQGLAKGSYYVQIGVFGTNESLQAAVAGFEPRYPLAAERLTTKSGEAAFRLYVGPLNRDESGLVLFNIRSRGFKDAYVKQGS